MNDIINQRTEKLLEAIGMIDDEIIMEADTGLLNLKRKSTKRKWHILTLAAAACLILVMTVMLIPNQIKEPEYFSQSPDDFDFSNLPMLTISENNMNTMGFEGYIAFHISDLDNGNPWSENDNIIALPVFKNDVPRNSAGEPIDGLSANEMIQKAKETAEAMGWTVDSVYTLPTEEDLQRYQDKMNSLPEDMRADYSQDPYQAIAQCGDFKVSAYKDGHVGVDFGDIYLGLTGMPLPDKYNFTQYDTTDKQAKEVMQYLLEEYKGFVNMKAPALKLFGDYNIYAQRLFSYAAYESDGDLVDKILGYNFDTVWFAPNENGNLWLMSRSTIDLSQKIGDYPIINATEARELLLQNKFITTVPLDCVPLIGDFIDKKYIASVELVYRNGGFDEVFMPYYKFLIELTGYFSNDWSGYGLKNFGVFYVPAIKSEYLTNMPLWDGRFN